MQWYLSPKSGVEIGRKFLPPLLGSSPPTFGHNALPFGFLVRALIAQ